MTYVNFKLDTDADGIALITWDAPGRSMNVIDRNVIEELSDIVETVAGDGAIRGAVITSGKEAFCAGADLTMLEASIHDALPISGDALRPAGARKEADLDF